MRKSDESLTDAKVQENERQRGRTVFKSLPDNRINSDHEKYI